MIESMKCFDGSQKVLEMSATKEEKQKAIDALKISAPVIAVTQEEFNNYIQTLNKVMNWLEQEPKTGHWIDKDEKSAVCSCCNRNNTLYGDFCKWCGAKMVEPQESEE